MKPAAKTLAAMPIATALIAIALIAIALIAIALIAIAAGAFPALAGPLDHSCLVGNRAAASLLFPYFEVDLAAADGTTTLISVASAHYEPLLAHVVVWTDWGLPTTAFDLALDAHQVQSLNMRAILAGQVPVTGDGFDGLIDAPSCTFPIPPPPVDVGEVRARHTGQPSPFSGLCYGSGRLGPEVATGYVTVDIVRDCSAGAIPGDPGYFDDGMGLATNDNLLFGELFLLEPGESFAQGIAAVPLLADTDLFEAGAGDPVVPDTFYGNRGLVGDADDRTPLSSRHRARFFHGGGFSGTTDLLIWTAGVGSRAEANQCGDGPFVNTGALPLLDIALKNEAGEPLETLFDFVPPAVTFRIAIGGDEIPLDLGQFGTVDIDTNLLSCLLIIPCLEPLQSWVASLVRASGLYSVGVEATRLDDPCL